MTHWIRKLFGLDFPDPAPGQVWRSRHSGRSFRVVAVELDDRGDLWYVTTQQQSLCGFAGYNPVPQGIWFYPSQWRWLLKDEARELVAETTERTNRGKDRAAE